MTRFTLGGAIPRLEDFALLRGAGRFSGDIHVDGALHAYVLRSPHAHALVRKIDTSDARRASGVQAILTGQDAKADGLNDLPCRIPVTNSDGTPRSETPRPVLAIERVRHVGDPVALVIADSLLEAVDAAEAIHVDYEPLQAICGAVEAATPGSPLLFPQHASNVCFDLRLGDTHGTRQAFSKAAHITSLEIVNNRLVAAPMETRAAIATYDPVTDRSTLHTPVQSPHQTKGLVTRVLNLDPSLLRVLAGNVGGSFGMKLMLYPEQPLTVWASRKLRRHVRWVADRSESFLSDTQGRDHHSLARIAVDANGKFLALEVTTHANMGAYLSTAGPGIPQTSFSMLTGPYRIPFASMHLLGVLTNSVPVDAYRGAGRPESAYLMERLVDQVAYELGLSPEEVRLANLVIPEEMPYATPGGLKYDVGDFPRILRMCMQEAGWEDFKRRKRASQDRNELLGIGIGMYLDRSPTMPDTIRIAVSNDKVHVFSGMQDIGTGQLTGLTQAVSDFMEIDGDKIECFQGDTDIVPEGVTAGSRFAAVATGAALEAVRKVVKLGLQVAADYLEVSTADLEYRDGMYRVRGTDRMLSIFEAARTAGTLTATKTYKPNDICFPNGCHICEVKIDPETGMVSIERYTIVDDVGRVMNPALLDGQVHGGTVQGLGQALLENAIYDRESGQLLTGSFMDYAMPRASDVPSFTCRYLDIPSPNNLWGAKGAGEGGAVGAPAAAVNAILDALRSVLRNPVVDMPVTSEKIWRMLNGRP